jgi:hypothetical protein
MFQGTVLHYGRLLNVKQPPKNVFPIAIVTQQNTASMYTKPSSVLHTGTSVHAQETRASSL